MKKLGSLFSLIAILSLAQAAQAQQTFKAQAPKREGEVTLIFRVYDQAVGGNKLSEEVQTVQVKNGMVEATITAPVTNEAKAILWVEMSNVSSPDVVIGNRGILPPNQASVSGIGLQPAAICYTCGGAWPSYQGTVPTASAATEYGPGCGGGLTTAYSDTFPYLCTKTDF